MAIYLVTSEREIEPRRKKSRRIYSRFVNGKGFDPIVSGFQSSNAHWNFHFISSESLRERLPQSVQGKAKLHEGKIKLNPGDVVMIPTYEGDLITKLIYIQYS